MTSGSFGIGITRTTMQLSSNNLLDGFQRTQSELLRLQGQISTGQAVSRPGEAPSQVSTISFLQQQVETRTQYDRNLSHAVAVLNSTDSSLADLTDILLQTRAIASSQVGVGSDATTRQLEVEAIDGNIDGALAIVNRSLAGVGLFTGGSSGAQGGQAFVSFLGGIRYVGATTNLANDTGFNDPLGFNSNGVDAFNALSSRVKGQIDLQPRASAQTSLRDIGGGLRQGFRGGSVAVTIDGNTQLLDLKTADTLGDVVTRVNNLINTIDPTAGSLAIAPDGLSLTAGAGHTITINEVGQGHTAGDLGIDVTVTAGTVVGADLSIPLTELTQLTDLGATIDFLSGLTITQASTAQVNDPNAVTSKVADFSGAETIQDLINVIDQLNMGVRLEINDAGNGLNLFSEVSGLGLSVSEANGGSTAADLGIRTFSDVTLLSDFRRGLGVENVTGEDDFEVRLSDGTTFAVDINAAVNVQDVIDTIAAAATAAGLTVGSPGDAGTDFNVGYAIAGNGFEFDDNTGGAGAFVIEDLGISLAATHLGIAKTDPAGTSIVGDDQTKVYVESFFTDLIDLRNSLQTDSTPGITFAGGHIEDALDRLARVRADVGVRAQRAEQQRERSVEMGLAEASLLSEVQDADLTAVITRFQQLQLQLQASFQFASDSQQLNLLNFLR